MGKKGLALNADDAFLSTGQKLDLVWIYTNVGEHDEALDLIGGRFREIKEQTGSAALAGFGSAKCSNEEAYLFQKLIRAAFKTGEQP